MNAKAALLVVLVSVAAHAEEKVETLRGQLHTYYSGEALAGIPFAGAGLASAGAGTGLLLSKDPTARGASVPMFSFAAIELAFGIYLAVRNPMRLKEYDAQLTANPEAFVTTERVRLKNIVHTYQPILLALWAAVSVAGGSFAIAGHVTSDRTMVGVGLGLAVQGLVMFLLDWTVLDRARAYENALEKYPL